MNRNFFNFSIFSVTLILALTVTDFSLVPKSVWATCSDCLTNPNIQTMSIYIHQTDDYPFLVGNATLLVSPNPFSNTENSTSDPSNWNNNLIVSDGDQYDADPTVGIIDLVGVNNGTYAIYELKNPSSVALTDKPVYVEINGSTGDVSVINLLLNVTNTATDLPPPTISDSTLDTLKNKGAMVNGITVSSGDDLPSSMIVYKDKATAITPPQPIIFSTKINSPIDASSLFTNLSIPTYNGPGLQNNSAFIPPLFSGTDNSGNSLVLTPIIDKITAGTELHMRLDNAGLGTGISPLSDISLPLSSDGNNVGVRLQVHNGPPSGLPNPPSNIARSLFLDIDSVGDIDLSDPNSFSTNPQIMYNVNLNTDNTCPPSTVFLRNTSTNTWDQVSPSPLRNPSADTSTTCGYIQTVQHFSSYLLGSGSSSSSSSSSGSSSGGGGGFGAVGIGPGAGGGGGGSGGMYYGGATNGGLSMYEIDYDVCTNNQVLVLAGTSGDPNSLGVKIRTAASGVITGTLNTDQPLENKHAYWFTIPLSDRANFFTVYVENALDSISKPVTTSGCTGKLVLSVPGQEITNKQTTSQSGSEMQNDMNSMGATVPEFNHLTIAVFMVSIISIVMLSRFKNMRFAR